MTQPAHSQDQLLNMQLRTVGILVNQATLCDLVLFNAFRVVSGCEPSIANAIYFANESLNAKKNIVKRVLVAIGDKEETKIVEAIITAVEKANNKRNELSHSLLQSSGDQLHSLNARQQGKPPRALTAKYLDDLHKNASSAYVECLRQYQLLCQKRGLLFSVVHT